MAPITWKNIDAPNFLGSAQGMALAGRSFDAMGNELSGVIDRQEKVNDLNWNNQADINTEDAVARLRGLATMQGFNDQEANFDPTALRDSFGRQINNDQVQAELLKRKGVLTVDAVGAASGVGMSQANSTMSSPAAMAAFRQDLEARGVKDPAVINAEMLKFQASLSPLKEGWDEQRKNLALDASLGVQPQADVPGGPVDSSMPRGVRNNNPGNLNFAGQVGAVLENNPNARFASFSTPEAGLAALDHQLSIYGSRDKIDTLAGVISKWAPPSENKTDSLIKNAAAFTGLDPNQKINLSDPATLIKVREAIIKQEGNGGTTNARPNTQPTSSVDAQFAAGRAQNPALYTAAMYENMKRIEAEKLKLDDAATVRQRSQLAEDQKQADRTESKSVETDVAAMLNIARKNNGDPTEAYAYLNGKATAGKARKEFNAQLESMAQPTLLQQEQEKVVAADLQNAIKATADEHALSLGQVTANIGMKDNLADSALLKAASDKPGGIVDLMGAQGTTAGFWADLLPGSDVKFNNSLKNGVTKKYQDLRAAGATEELANRIILQTFKSIGGNRQGWSGNTGIDMDEFIKHYGAAAEHELSVGKLKGQKASIESNMAASNREDLQLAVNLQSQLKDGRIRSNISGEKWAIPEATQKLITDRKGAIKKSTPPLSQSNPNVLSDTTERAILKTAGVVPDIKKAEDDLRKQVSNATYGRSN